MREKIYFISTFCLLVFVAALHLVRIYYGADIIVGDIDVPIWVSWWALLATGLLSLSGFHLYNKNK